MADTVEETELMNPADEYESGERKTSLTSSRFQVAKVDFASDTPKCKFSNDVDEAERQPLTEQTTSAAYDTHNVRSLRHYTREALPRADHYRNVMSVHGQMNRPTLEELHHPSLSTSPHQVFYFVLKLRLVLLLCIGKMEQIYERLIFILQQSTYDKLSAQKITCF